MGKIYGNRWEIVKHLDEGGQGWAYLVKDIKGQGEILYVLKRLKNKNRIERFKREIETVRTLSHPNIVQLVDFDPTAKEPYLVTEYCSGGSLANNVKSFWQDSPVAALEIFQQICEGVVFAHSKGVTHRDLKPDNIFLRSKDGPAVVGDFGICHLEEDGTRITITEEAVGPVYYMAPELEDGRVDQVTTKSDIYSLGKVLYWLLSGGKIFSREKHREENWDLKGSKKWSGRNATEEVWDNIYMEHVNRLLDNMIVRDPQKRIDVNRVLVIAQDVTRLVKKEFTPIAKDILAPCLFCGQGRYQLKVQDLTGLRNFGLNPLGPAPDFRIMVCNACGHIQMFQIDIAEKSQEWWGSDTDRR